MKMIVIGGTFDDTKGKASALIDLIATQIRARNHTVILVNGGNVGDLPALFDMLGAFEAVLWFPDVPNNYGKNVGLIKQVYPKVLLVTSKRNDENKYSFEKLINHALVLKSNLVLEFSACGGGFHGRVFDPLGCLWADTSDFMELTEKMTKRLERLAQFTRVSSRMTGPVASVINTGELPDFYDFVKERANVFHDLVHPDGGVERFLGNASFRCDRGFPSFKEAGAVFVSRRNVDKRYIGPDAFVQVRLDEDDHVEYWGEHKPSVDTPIQLRLYERYVKTKYMLHSHVYIKDAPFTECAVSCGAMEEYEEIEAATNKWEDYWTAPTNFALNLIGHGSIVLADNLAYMRSVEYYAREIPETMW